MKIKHLFFLICIQLTGCGHQYLGVPQISIPSEEWINPNSESKKRTFIDSDPTVVRDLSVCSEQIKKKINVHTQDSTTVLQIQDEIDLCMVDKGFHFNNRAVSGIPPCRVNPARAVCKSFVPSSNKAIAPIEEKEKSVKSEPVPSFDPKLNRQMQEQQFQQQVQQQSNQQMNDLLKNTGVKR